MATFTGDEPRLLNELITSVLPVRIALLIHKGWESRLIVINR